MTDQTIFRAIAENGDGDTIIVVGYDGEDGTKYGRVVRTLPGVADIWSTKPEDRVECIETGRYQVVATGKTYRPVGPW